MNPKYFLFALSFSLLNMSVAHGEFLDSNGVMRWDNGGIMYVSQYEAGGINTLTMKKVRPDVCELYGAHLPTARELAKEAQARGAKGILEVNQVRLAGKPDGYYEISAINPDGQEDLFYFNEDGYKRPDGLFEGMLFWSSSAVSFSKARAFLFDGGGGLPYGGRYGEHAVRCATGH